MITFYCVASDEDGPYLTNVALDVPCFSEWFYNEAIQRELAKDELISVHHCLSNAEHALLREFELRGE